MDLLDGAPPSRARGQGKTLERVLDVPAGKGKKDGQLKIWRLDDHNANKDMTDLNYLLVNYVDLKYSNVIWS